MERKGGEKSIEEVWKGRVGRSSGKDGEDR